MKKVIIMAIGGWLPYALFFSLMQPAFGQTLQPITLPNVEQGPGVPDHFDLRTDHFETGGVFQAHNLITIKNVTVDGFKQNTLLKSGRKIEITSPAKFIADESTPYGIVMVVGDLSEDINTMKTAAESGPEEIYTVVPNPAKSSTALTYYVPEDSPVHITLHDQLGRLVQIVVENSLITKGHYNQTIDLNGYSSGLYVVRINIGMNVRAIKVLVE